MAGISIKRGADLSQRMVMTEAKSGAFVDLTGWSIECHVRNGDTLVEKLDVEITDAAGGVFFLTSDTTKEWPVKRLASDLRMTIPDTGKTFSERFFFDVQETVTYD